MLEIEDLSVETFLDAYRATGLKPTTGYFVQYATAGKRPEYACAMGALAIQNGSDPGSIIRWTCANIRQGLRLQIQRGFDGREPSPVFQDGDELAAYEIGRQVAEAVGLPEVDIIP